MESLRQVGSGILFGLVCVIVVVGGFSLSLAEGGVGAVVVPTVTPVPSSSPIPPTVVIPTTAAPSLVTETLEPSATPSPTASFTPPPPPTSCLPPSTWIAIVVQPNDTLASLAQTYRTSSDEIRKWNCLISDQLVSGSFLYVPPLPTATSIPCGAPSGWVNYLVRPGDTLYSISLLYRVKVSDLQRANCLGNSNYIQAGKFIKVPNVATSTPWAVTPTFVPTDTATQAVIITDTPSATPSQTPSVTDTVAPTATLEPTSTTPPTATSTPETPSS